MGFGRKPKEPFQLLVFSERNQIKLKKFKTKSALRGFVTKFKKKYPDLERKGDNWIDYVVWDVLGDIEIHDPSNWMV